MPPIMRRITDTPANAPITLGRGEDDELEVRITDEFVAALGEGDGEGVSDVPIDKLEEAGINVVVTSVEEGEPLGLLLGDVGVGTNEDAGIVDIVEKDKDDDASEVDNDEKLVARLGETTEEDIVVEPVVTVEGGGSDGGPSLISSAGGKASGVQPPLTLATRLQAFTTRTAGEPS